MTDISPNHGELRERRIGVALHYPEGDFATVAAWCRLPKAKNPKPVSYNLLIGPNGETDLMVPWDLRCWGMGECRPSITSRSYVDANSAFESIALSGGPAFGPPTSAQEQTLNEVLFDRFKDHNWPLVEWWRLVGHDQEAWPRGRKQDPTGDSHGYGPSKPWLDMEGVRKALAATQP